MIFEYTIGKIVCPSCLCLRFGPHHLFARMIGACEGSGR